MRIVSFSPSATELVCALGHSSSLVGISHACDYPNTILDRPRVTSSRLPCDLPLDRIDQRVHAAERLYDIDRDRLAALDPDLVITQRQCTVCAVGDADVRAVLDDAGHAAHVVALAASQFDELAEDVRRIGAAIHDGLAAEGILDEWARRLDVVRAETWSVAKPRVLALSWFTPLLAAGHWVTDMIAMAGGVDDILPRDAPSRRIDAASIAEHAPDVVLLMPCGVSRSRCIEEWARQRMTFPWSELHAVRHGSVFAVEGALFHRPGPRLLDGIELLAGLLHSTTQRRPHAELFTVAS
jgi:iron complex transport system substrate-binding protein